MLSKLIRILPDFILNPIYNAIFAKLIRRDNIVFEDELISNDKT